MPGIGYYLTREQRGIIKKDAYDVKLYNNIRNETPKITDVENTYREELPTIDLLLEDLWAGLYKAMPERAETVPPMLKLNEQLLNTAENLLDWKDLRDSTMLDEWASALGSVVVGEKVLQEIPEDAKNNLKDAVECGIMAQKLFEEATFLEEGVNYAENAEKKKELQKKAQELKQKAHELAQKAEEQTEDIITKIKKEIRDAVKKGTEEAGRILQNTNAILHGFGTGNGQPSAVESKKAFDIAMEMLKDPVFLKIAETAGRMITTAVERQKTKPNYQPQENAGIITGHDIQRLVATEYAYLANPILKHEFYRKFAESSLLQYELKGKEALKKGPIVVCVDTSGSMDGIKSLWSRGVALGLLTIARRQKRGFAAVMFGAKNEIKTFEFAEPEKASIDDIIAMARFAFQGGTDFETPLATAMEIMKKSEYQQGDIIFITDGQASMSQSFIENFNRTKKEKEFRVIVVLMPEGWIKPIDAVAEQVIRTEPLPGKDNEVLNIVFSI